MFSEKELRGLSSTVRITRLLTGGLAELITKSASSRCPQLRLGQGFLDLVTTAVRHVKYPTYAAAGVLRPLETHRRCVGDDVCQVSERGGLAHTFAVRLLPLPCDRMLLSFARRVCIGDAFRHWLREPIARRRVPNDGASRLRRILASRVRPALARSLWGEDDDV